MSKIKLIKQQCPKCKQGEMLPSGEVVASSPPKFVHQCNKCGHKDMYTQAYPYVDYIKNKT